MGILNCYACTHVLLNKILRSGVHALDIVELDNHGSELVGFGVDLV